MTVRVINLNRYEGICTAQAAACDGSSWNINGEPIIHTTFRSANEKKKYLMGKCTLQGGESGEFGD